MMIKIFRIAAGLCLSVLLFFSSLLPAIEEDGYPIENERLNKYYGPIEWEDCAAGDLAWFVSDTRDEALVIGLYTDYHRTRYWHFNPEDMPEIVFNSIGFGNRKSKKEWISVSPEQKSACLEHFLEIADRIPSRYFITNKGFKLGMPLQKFIDYYGDPTHVETISEGKFLSWDFAGDPSIPDMIAKEGQSYMENSFGYHLKILFDNDRARAIIMISDVP